MFLRNWRRPNVLRPIAVNISYMIASRSDWRRPAVRGRRGDSGPRCHRRSWLCRGRSHHSRGIRIHSANRNVPAPATPAFWPCGQLGQLRLGGKVVRVGLGVNQVRAWQVALLQKTMREIGRHRRFNR